MIDLLATLIMALFWGFVTMVFFIGATLYLGVMVLWTALEDLGAWVWGKVNV